MAKTDIHLIFPPQWSPFQPFLSTPALVAYLKERGYSAIQSDWNVELYDYLISRGRLGSTAERLDRYVRTLARA